jgi:hypothetical protein
MTVPIFYVRPACEAGYGCGDGRSYENAWNGFENVDWSMLARGDPAATLWVCGAADGPQGFLALNIEWSYLNLEPRIDLQIAQACTDTRRESSQPV